MPRGVKDFEWDITKSELFTILGRVEVEIGCGTWSIDDLGSGQLGKVDVTRHKISMEMSLKNVLNLGISLLG